MEKSKQQKEEKESLNSEITRVTDNSPCPYEDIIQVLQDQIKWFKKARKQEHGV